MANNIERSTQFTEGQFYGRMDIFSSVDEVTDENVVSVVNDALFWHARNLYEETELLWYCRGRQPVLDRKKKRNRFVCNKVVCNHATEIVTFKSGFFLTQPAVAG